MSETKHTPGPWMLAEAVTGRHAITNMRRIRSKNEELEHGAICEVYGVADGSVAHANARLIAAAPELLEALKLMLAGTQKDCGKVCMPGDNAVRSAFAAIAKATGGQS